MTSLLQSSSARSPRPLLLVKEFREEAEADLVGDWESWKRMEIHGIRQTASKSAERAD